eukprot:7377710-Ditylum_brightwellii.AAC.1
MLARSGAFATFPTWEQGIKSVFKSSNVQMLYRKNASILPDADQATNLIPAASHSKGGSEQDAAKS